MKRLVLGILVAFLLLSLAAAGERKPVKLSPKDKCPVCGMFVTKYPDWTAQIIFKDGSYAVFDGAKDMFKYYFNLKKYNPAKTSGEIASLYIMDYYGLTLIDGFRAFHVMGSNIYGPMGPGACPHHQGRGSQRVFERSRRKENIDALVKSRHPGENRGPAIL